MGLFDFLKPTLSATPGAVMPGKQRLAQGVQPVMAPEDLAFGSGDVGPLQMPPVLREQSFMDRMTAPKNGASFADRALMAMLALNGQAGAAVQMRQGLKDQSRKDDERQARNAALKQAYGEDGKFNMRRYMDALGDGGDALEGVDIQRALAPKTGVDDGFFYSVDPDGTGRWGEQRKPSYAEQLSYDRQNDPEREELLNAQTEAYLALAEQRKHQGDYYGAKARQPYAPQRPRAAGKAGPMGSAPPIPPGFRVVQP